MPGGQSFTLSDEQIGALPLEDVALAVLSDAAANEVWNSSNWIGLAQQGHVAGQRYSRESIRILSEAWQWLHNRGLVAEGLDNTSIHAVFVTRLGHRVAAQGPAAALAESRLALDLHPILEQKVRGLFLPGKYDTAAFEALKAVEVRVRSLSEQSDSMVGVKLMRDAFGEGGALRNRDADPGEQVARMELFAGAIGVFKNPTSHRDIVLDDPTEAAEVILLADLLMRILDRIESEELAGR
jgi:uncharacterized protein (TIGR02391 family)